MTRLAAASVVLIAGAMGCSSTESVRPVEDSTVGAADSALGDSSDDVPDAPVETSDATDADASDTTAEDAAVETSDASVSDGAEDSTSDGSDGGDDSAFDVSTDGATDGADAGGCVPSPAPLVTKTGVAGKLLLKGTIVTPDTFFDGEVLVEGDTITCVGACAASPGGLSATVVDTQGIIFPGLIDTHNHILFDIFDESHWSPTKAYGNHNQWTAEARYSAMVDAKQYLNGEGSSTWDYGCEMDKYGELKGLVSGTTSIAGAANPANRACYGSLARTIDQTPNGLPADKVQVATLFPTKSAADGVCTNFGTGTTDAYLIHIAEGIDATALGEFAKLGSLTTAANCLYAPKTTIVHGTALTAAQFDVMAAYGMKLTWSPRSNVFLYGGGTDLSKTTDVPLALAKGIDVALAPDWSLGGSQNLLDEMRFADKVDNTVWGDKLTPKMLVQMVTSKAAKNLGLDGVLGSIAVGKKADLMVIGGDTSKPYDALLRASPRDVRLVTVGGVALFGDSTLKPLGPATPGCETIDICCATKFLCVAVPGGTTTNKLGQTFAEIRASLAKALVDYDALGLTPYKFAPLTPLVRCAP